jgi:hypothetical protein
MTKELKEVTYDLDLFAGSQAAWDRSEGLRFVYGEIYAGIRRRCTEGSTLEIGSGIGAGKAFFEHLVTSDMVKTPYVDRAMSAYAIKPDREGVAWANIFAIDVLHHLMQALDFFESAANALKPGGYSRPQLLPAGGIKWLAKFEKYLPQFFFRLFGLRMVIVMEKTA